MESQGFTPVSVPEDGRESAPMAGSGLARLPVSRGQQWLQALILVLLYSVPAIAGLRLAFVSDPDVWSHMRTGEWILQHGGVPQTDPFSTFGAGKPWQAYSWLFELLVYQCFQRLGLAGLVVYTTAMVVAITVALHRLIQRLQIDFTFAVLMTVVASFAICRLYTPRPWLFTILFFVLEIDILMQARRSGRMRELLWLPLIFALWANVHIQFVDGMVVLAIALAESVLSRRWIGVQTRIRPAWMGGIFIACMLAVMVNPYGWTIYRVGYEVGLQPGIFTTVSEYRAILFRNADDWCVLLFALAATGVLARARRFAFFESVLLAFAIIVSFRAQRDVWVLVIVASAILAAGFNGDEKNRFCVTAFAAPFVVVATVLAVLLGFRAMDVSNARLQTDLAKELPVRAVEAIKVNGWSGPLFNDYNWGAYLIWALRQPVSIDGRTNVHGDQRIERSGETWGGQPDWASDPDLVKAGLVIGPVKAPLTQLLRMDPHFELAYEDKLAAVFVARKAQPSGSAGVAAAGANTPAQAAAK
jgi:hypothetical protein